MGISPYKTNHDHYEEFKRSIDGNTVAFTGAGTSVVSGIPIWTLFLRRLNETTNANADIEPLLKVNDVYGSASLIYNSLPDPQYFYQGIAELIVEDQRANYIDIHIAIWTVFHRVVTTNYDDCFQKAFLQFNAGFRRMGNPELTFVLQRLPDLNFDQFERSVKSLAHIHGKAGLYELVLRSEDYQKYYPSCNPGKHPDPCYHLEEFLTQLVNKYSFAFIGFSLEDADFVNTFENIREKQKELLKDDHLLLKEYEDRKHFIFLRNDDLKNWINIQDLVTADLDPRKLLLGNILKAMEGDPERFVFRMNFQNSPAMAGLTLKEQRATLELHEVIVKHDQKLKRLKNLNILDIRVTGNDYKAISELLVQSLDTAGSADHIDVNEI